MTSFIAASVHATDTHGCCCCDCGSPARTGRLPMLSVPRAAGLVGSLDAIDALAGGADIMAGGADIVAAGGVDELALEELAIGAGALVVSPAVPLIPLALET